MSFKMDQAFPLCFTYCKQSKTGQWEGLEMKLLGYTPHTT